MSEATPRMIAEDVLADYLLGALEWCGILLPSPGRREADRALETYARVVAQGFFHLPSFLVVDLLLLLERGFEASFASDRELADWNEEQRTLRSRYEREILGRVLQAPGLGDLLEILSDSPDREAQTERLIVLLLETLAPHMPRSAVVNPALVRSLHRSGDGNHLAERQQRFLDWLGDERYFYRLLGDFLDATSQHVQWGRLIRDEDIFELSHWRSLSTEHLRIGCRQILAVDRRLGERTLRQRIQVHDAGEAETVFVDETHYPMGGLAELTNRGSLENLVTSQLIYIEPGPAINVFDVRYLEGELLYYMRDEGSLRRKRRTVHLIFDLGTAFEWKARGWDYQFSVLSQGLGLRLLNDLFKVFEHDSVHACFHYLRGGVDSTFLRAEIDLMRLLLDDAVRHGWVEFHETEELDPDTLRDPKRKIYALAISAERAEHWQGLWNAEIDRQPRIHGAVVQVANAAQFEALDPGALALARDGMTWPDFSDLRTRIVTRLVG